MSAIGSLTSTAISHLGQTQNTLLKTGTELSTGLAINSAADNPSGLAIYENLTAQANGFDQGLAERARRSQCDQRSPRRDADDLRHPPEHQRSVDSGCEQLPRT